MRLVLATGEGLNAAACDRLMAGLLDERTIASAAITIDLQSAETIDPYGAACLTLIARQLVQRGQHLTCVMPATAGGRASVARTGLAQTLRELVELRNLSSDSALGRGAATLPLSAIRTRSDVQAVLAAAIGRVGVPQRFLSDNGAALNPTRRGLRGIVESWLRGQGVQVISSRPGHPQTQGKSERHHQTSQRWLAARDPADDLTALQALLDQLEDAYNNRPHQSLGMLTPLQAWAATPVTPPPPPSRVGGQPGDPADRDTIDTRTVGANGAIHVRMIRIQLGVEHAGRTVLTTYAHDDIHVWDRDGLHLRTITVIPGKGHYGNGRRPGRPGPPKVSGK